MDSRGGVGCYDLDVKQQAQATNIRRRLQVPEALPTAVDLVVKYMPMKADRGLPGELFRVMADCGWVPLPRIPRIFKYARVPLGPPPGCGPQRGPSPGRPPLA